MHEPCVIGTIQRDVPPPVINKRLIRFVTKSHAIEMMERDFEIINLADQLLSDMWSPDLSSELCSKNLQDFQAIIDTHRAQDPHFGRWLELEAIVSAGVPVMECRRALHMLECEFDDDARLLHGIWKNLEHQGDIHRRRLSPPLTDMVKRPRCAPTACSAAPWHAKTVEDAPSPSS